jgi:formylglycine-generating enzyme
MTKAFLFVGVWFIASAGAQAEGRWTDPVSGLEFVKVPAGCFDMGADRPGATGTGWNSRVPGVDEVPRHKVCVDGFWLSASEVTRGAYSMVTGVIRHVTDLPVASVSWDEAVRFGALLSEKSAARFRLPTEAEWEWACHAGQPKPVAQPTGEEWFSLVEETAKVAWYRYGMGRDPTILPVMKKQPNAWGLYDMLGNAWEWVADGYDETAYSRHALNAPKQVPVDDRRVIRGGSYKTDIAQVRCGARNHAPVEERTALIGFRILRELDPKTPGDKK